MDILAYIRHITNKYHTSNPFDIVEQSNITLFVEPLGSIKGYYCKILGSQFIHISDNLCYHEQRFVCAHELGHALIHPEISLRYTIFPQSKYEKQANKFAVYLLLKDISCEFPWYDTYQLARTAGIPLEALEAAL